MAWDVRGDHKKAIRASAGLFYDFPRGGNSAFIGVPPVSFNQVVNNLTMDQLASFSKGGSLTFTQNPVGAPAATVAGDRHSLPVSYQVNVAYQRDIGFSTTAEIAWVGNFGRHFWRIKEANNVAPFTYANPATLLNNEPVNANLFRRDYPGISTVRYLTTDEETLSPETLAEAVNRAARAPLPPAGLVELNGAQRSAELLQEWLP